MIREYTVNLPFYKSRIINRQYIILLNIGSAIDGISSFLTFRLIQSSVKRIIEIEPDVLFLSLIRAQSNSWNLEMFG